MAPYKLRDATIVQLRELRKGMLSLDYQLARIELPLKLQRESALQLSDIQYYLTSLEVVELAEIRTELVKNEDELKESIADVEESIGELAEIEQSLAIVSGFLQIVARII